jgi:hypothetical protein
MIQAEEEKLKRQNTAPLTGNSRNKNYGAQTICNTNAQTTENGLFGQKHFN